MKKPAFLLVACLVAGAALMGCGKPADPEQSIAIINNGDAGLSVTLQAMKDDGTYGEDYYRDITVAPGEIKYDSIGRGTYLVSAWDGNNDLIREVKDFKVSLADGKDNVIPVFIDALGEKSWALVNLNFLYEGKTALAEEIAGVAGTDDDELKIEHFYTPDAFFSIPADCYDGKIVFPGEKLPEEVSTGTTVYALVPASGTTADEALFDVYAQVADLAGE